MTYNDYVILVDENGQPYIAHGERYQRFRTALRNRAHKYLEKFPNLYRTGRTAYAYTENQLRQMRNYARTGGRKLKRAAEKAGRYIDDHDAGITERIQARALQSKAKRVGKKDRDAGNALNAEASRLRRQGKSEYENSGLKKAVDKAGRAGRKAAKFIDDHDAGITERIQARALESRANRVGKKDKDAGRELAAEAARIRRQGKSEFENSRVKKAADTVSKYGSTTLSAVKGAGTKDGNAVSGATSKASGSVKNAISNAQSTINDVIDRKITGATAGQNLSKATQNAVMGLDGAVGEVADAQQALSKAIIGGNANKIEAARETLSEAVSGAKSFLAKTGNLFTKSEKAAIESALNYELDPVTGEWVLKR